MISLSDKHMNRSMNVCILKIPKDTFISQIDIFLSIVSIKKFVVNLLQLIN
jgi:hypothetical protein